MSFSPPTSASVKCFLQSDFQLIASADDGRAAGSAPMVASPPLVPQVLGGASVLALLLDSERPLGRTGARAG